MYSVYLHKRKTDCAIENNIKRSTLTAWLNGQNKNKSNFRFL